MTPIEWLESQPLDSPETTLTRWGVPDDPMGRVMLRGGGTVFGHIKSDACVCRTEWHEEMHPCAYGFRSARAVGNCLEPYGVNWAGLDPYDVAVKRGAPA